MAELQRQGCWSLALSPLHVARIEPWYYPNPALYTTFVSSSPVTEDGTAAAVDVLVEAFLEEKERGGGFVEAEEDVYKLMRLVRTLVAKERARAAWRVYKAEVRMGGCEVHEYIYRVMARGMKWLGFEAEAAKVEADFREWEARILPPAKDVLDEMRAKPPPPPPPPPPPRLRGDETKKKKKPDVRTAAEAAQGLQRHEVERRKKQPPPPKQEKAKRVVRWKCAAGCGACCKLDKGPDFPSPEEIFAEHPEDLKLYKSMIGADGWCINYDKSTRTCNIYEERPVFCRVEPKVFEEYFGVPSRPSTFDREACSACVDTIKMVYGEESAELTNFKRVIREESKFRRHQWPIM
ncbi:hypothetical protein OsI_11674 [Oryza sativa Indica Group]|uniref:Uncharacterized protein n=1 Tax=Oryza sativa subsp. indica TaxID=39946 RepID=B8APW8_ORYSI|nr:hypothetical protein OsI_11674 [Oryza sativa Indica Group]